MIDRKQVFEILRATTPGEITGWLRVEFQSILNGMQKFGLVDEGIALIPVRYSEATTSLFTWDAHLISTAEDETVIHQIGRAEVEMRKAGERTQITGYCDTDQLQPFLVRLQTEIERVFPPANDMPAMADIEKPLGTWTLNIPFDVLDTLVSKYIRGKVEGFADYKREQITSGRTVYTLNHRQLGDFGFVEVCKSSNQVSDLAFRALLLPPLRPNREEINKLRQERCEQVREHLLYRIREHEENLSRANQFFEKPTAASDVVSSANDVPVEVSQGKRKRGPNTDTHEKLNRLVKQKRESIRNRTVTVSFSNACDLAGVSPETVKANAPEIQEQWNNPDYLPEFA